MTGPPSKPPTHPLPDPSVSSSLPPLLPVLLTLPPVSLILHQSLHVGLLPRALLTSLLSLVSLLLVSHFIRALVPLFLRARMHGKDINKRGTPAGHLPIPEPLGLIPAAVYILVLCLQHVPARAAGDVHLYTAAMACVAFMTLLGFADDVLDLKWRYKLVLPLLASMPLLVNYTGATTVVLPRGVAKVVALLAQAFGGGAVQSASGRLVNLGAAYYVYMALLSIFCTNAINIYAGINGLEAGQSAVIAAFVLVHNALNLSPSMPKDDVTLLRAHHAFSIDMILPFLAVTIGLLVHNWYPSRVFVGDTYCYFAGMCFAMAAILGHYSLTLLLFFVPQIVNFLYSTPQLFGLVPCPRHRLPVFNRETGKLEAVRTHMNLVNLVLRVCGPMTERELCVVLLVLQVVCCAGGLAARYLALKYVLV